MDQVIKVFFEHEAYYYSAYVTIVHEFETDFIYIELLDEYMIYTFDTPCLIYRGIKGYKEHPAYQSRCLRGILIVISEVIINAQQLLTDPRAKKFLDEAYSRLN